MRCSHALWSKQKSSLAAVMLLQLAIVSCSETTKQRAKRINPKPNEAIESITDTTNDPAPRKPLGVVHAAESDAKPEPSVPDESAPIDGWRIDYPKVRSDQHLKMLAKHLDVSKAYVEEFTGLKFKTLPSIVVPNDREWFELIAKEGGGKLKDPHQAAIVTWAIFLQEKNTIALSPITAESLDGEDDSSLFVRGTLVHELTHHVQEEHFGLLSRFRSCPTRQEKFVLRSFVEGHALLVQQTYLDHTKIHYEPRRLYSGKPNWYMLGRAYLKAISAPDGSLDLKEVFREGNEPPYLEFMNIATQPVAK